MRRLPDSFDASVSAFRDMTTATAEASATRARVLARAERAARRRGLIRRGAVPLGIVLASLLSGAALTAAGLHWRAPALIQIADHEDGSRPAGIARIRAPMRTVPALREDGPPSPERADAEAIAYERAHRAHFFADAPAQALAAWDAYLASYPRGTFAPEARYNRALCLARLGRFAAAAEAIRPFAAGRRGSYRRTDACTLLRWLSERDPRIDAGASCRS